MIEAAAPLVRDEAELARPPLGSRPNKTSQGTRARDSKPLFATAVFTDDSGQPATQVDTFYDNLDTSCRQDESSTPSMFAGGPRFKYRMPMQNRKFVDLNSPEQTSGQLLDVKKHRKGLRKHRKLST